MKRLSYVLYPMALAYKYTFKAFRFVTGKDSVVFAWVMFLVMNAYSLAGDGIRHVSPWTVTRDSLWVLWTWYLTRDYQENTKSLKPNELLTVSRWTGLLVFYAFMYSFFIVIELAMLEFIYMGRSFLYALWTISLLIYNPGGKSVWAKAKEKIAEMSQVRTPIFAPVGV